MDSTRNIQVLPDVYLCAEPVELSWRAAYGEYVGSAILVEVSRAGALFSAEAAVPPGTRVRVRLPHAQLEGTSESCRRQGCSYALRVRIEAAGEWVRMLAPSDAVRLAAPMHFIRSDVVTA